MHSIAATTIMITDAFNNLFSKHSMQLIIDEGYCDVLDEALDTVGLILDEKTLTNRIVFHSIYQYMNRYYRNEYFYKNTLLQKLVFGIHSPKTTTALCELPVADSIVDFVLINGRAVAYEIKTELDNLARLKNQIEDYYKAFRFVCIVCHEKAATKLLEEYAESPVGIYVLNRRGQISKRKSAHECNTTINPAVQFSMLRKRERDEALLSAGLQLPDVSQMRYYRASLELFESISTQQRSIIFESTLKDRKKNIDLKALELLPNEFKLLGYLNNVSLNDANCLDSYLDLDYKA